MNALLGDCGGTFSRFALLESGEIRPLIKLRNAQFANFKDVVITALNLCKVKPTHAALAIAGIDNCNTIKFVNNHLYASRTDLFALGFETVHFMNDFVPLALSLSNLDALNINYLDERKPQKGHRLVVGVGTGIGIGVLLHVGDKFMTLATEGGHVYYGGASEIEKAVIAHLKEPLIYIETLLSGEGFLKIYRALCQIEGQTRLPDHTSESLVSALLHDPVAQQAARLFWDILARACDNFSLTMLTHGGLYLTGGMCERLQAYLNPIRFRDIFTSKPHYHSLLDKMPIGLIGATDPAFFGLKALLEKPQLFLKNEGVHEAPLLKLS